MTGLHCRKIGMLLARRATGLSEAERLVVEDHLARCAACSADATMLDGLGALSDQAALALPAATRERAIGRALRDATSAEWRTAAAIGRERSPLLPWGFAAAAAMVVLAGVWWLHRPRPIPAAPTAPIVDRVLSGEVEASGRTLRPGDAIPAGSALRASGDAVLAVAHGRVTAARGTVVTWQAERATVALESGSIDVAVDPAPHRPFRVSTPRFDVEVLGTQFSVDLQGVRVTRGIVRVLSPAGDVLVAGLHAGESWASPPEAPPAMPAPTRPPVERRRVTGASRHLGAAHWLVAARRHLAARDLDAAEHEIEAALAAHPTRRQRAEAHTLRAERAQVAGDSEGAATLYLEVASQFGDLRAGEVALFDAARLEANSGQRDKATVLFQRYLHRYPSGPFAGEARARLRALTLRPSP